MKSSSFRVSRILETPKLAKTGENCGKPGILIAKLLMFVLRGKEPAPSNNIQCTCNLISEVRIRRSKRKDVKAENDSDEDETLKPS